MKAAKLKQKHSPLLFPHSADLWRKRSLELHMKAKNSQTLGFQDSYLTWFSSGFWWLEFNQNNQWRIMFDSVYLLSLLCHSSGSKKSTAVSSSSSSICIHQLILTARYLKFKRRSVKVCVWTCLIRLWFSGRVRRKFLFFFFYFFWGK